MDLWHCQIDGQTKGPFAVSMLELMITEGSLTAQTMVCQVGQEQWTTAAEVPGLFGTAAAAPGAPQQQPASPAPPAPSQAMPAAPQQAVAQQPVAPAVPQSPHSAVQPGDESEQEDRSAAGRMLKRRRRNSAGALIYILASVGVLVVVLIVLVAMTMSGGDEDNNSNAATDNKKSLEPVTAEAIFREINPWRDAVRTTSRVGQKARLRILAASLLPDADDEQQGELAIEVQVENQLDEDVQLGSGLEEYPPGSIDPAEPLAVDDQDQLLEYIGPSQVGKSLNSQEELVIKLDFRYRSPPGDYIRVALPLAWFDSKNFIGFEIPSSMWEAKVVDSIPIAPNDPPVVEPLP